MATLAPGRALLLSTVSEEAFLQHVIDLAKRAGWWTYHVRDSRKSPHGWPDLVLVRPPRLFFAELKSASGRLTYQQRFVHDLLRRCGLDVVVWRPGDEQEIESVLGMPSIMQACMQSGRLVGTTPDTKPPALRKQPGGGRQGRNDSMALTQFTDYPGTRASRGCAP